MLLLVFFIGVSTIFRTVDSEPVYRRQPTLSPYFYAVMTVNYAINTAWIFVWLDAYVVGATIVLLFITYTAWIAIGIACYRLQLKNVHALATGR